METELEKLLKKIPKYKRIWYGLKMGCDILVNKFIKKPVCKLFHHNYKLNNKQCKRCGHIYQEKYILHDDALYKRIGDYNGKI